MKTSVEKILNEIDKFDNIESRCIVTKFEKKIKKEINMYLRI